MEGRVGEGWVIKGRMSRLRSEDEELLNKTGMAASCCQALPMVALGGSVTKAPIGQN